MSTIREQLEPLIREAGVNEVSRRAGIPAPRLYDWFAGRRDLYTERLEAVAKAVGRPLQLRPKRVQRGQSPSAGPPLDAEPGGDSWRRLREIVSETTDGGSLLDKIEADLLAVIKQEAELRDETPVQRRARRTKDLQGTPGSDLVADIPGMPLLAVFRRAPSARAKRAISTLHAAGDARRFLAKHPDASYLLSLGFGMGLFVGAHAAAPGTDGGAG